MKKCILLASELLLSLMVFSQNNRILPFTSADNTAKRIEALITAETHQVELDKPATPRTTNIAPSNEFENELPPVAGKTTSYVSIWNAIGSSINAYGATAADARPLQYNEDLNAVTFIHRKSPTYAASPAPVPNAESGVIVGVVTQNWGANWDSTCLWNDNTNWGRFPQGAIVSSPGNFNINNAMLVGSTALTNATGWIGNGFYSKPMGLANYNNVAPATSTFFPTLSATLGKADFAIYDFQSTEDGKVVSLGYVNNNPNGTGTAFGYRGARIVKGSFVAGNLIWTSDSVIPSVTVSSGGKDLISRPRMVWSEDGQVGYVIHIGVSSTATLNNRGYQPIIFRTNNGGAAWGLVNGIDFNLPAMSTVTNMVMSPNSNSNVVIPFFDWEEGLGLTVDKDNKLHIACTLKGTYSSHPDSLGFTFSFNHADGEKYGYRHTPGERPYLYDFTGDGLPNSPWKVTLIDSLSSEGPGTDPNTDPDGFTTNPWAPDNGTKIAVGSRIQCSRTPDGKYIVYTWAESDTLFTQNAFKWNELPNIHARLMDVTAQTIHSLEINITKSGNNPAVITNTNVASRAYLHYASPKCALAQTVQVGASGPALVLPLTTSRPYGMPLLPNHKTIHRYASALLNFGGISQDYITLPATPFTPPVPNPTLSISNESALNSANGCFLYPNPAKSSANLVVQLNDHSNIEVSVVNMIGQVVRISSFEATAGGNTLNIDLNDLCKGVYMVKIKVANVTSSKKLIVE